MMINSDTIIGTTCNGNGNFRLKVPIGRRSFKTSFIGYEDFFVPNILVSSGKEIELTLEMRE